MPEIDQSVFVPEDQFPQETAQCLRDWQRQRPAWQVLVTPTVVQSLSRWSKVQMQAYRQVPPLVQVTFKLVGRDDSGRKLFYEGIVDTLPTHHALVTRWLKLFLVYDKVASRITDAVLTIRGQVLE